jgi:hypothetical protein
MYVRTGRGFGEVPHATTLDRPLRDESFSTLPRGLGQPLLPHVAAFRFRNTGTVDPENCCVVCSTQLPATGGRLNLGVGLRGSGAVPLRAANGMELSFRISGHRAGFEYDITRTRRNSFWERVGGVWRRLESDPMGTQDDHHDDDECLRLTRSNRIFAVDRPHWRNIALPAPAAQPFRGNTGVLANAAATQLVRRSSFAEWVIVRSKSEGIPWSPLELPPFRDGTRRWHIYWHSITWLIRDPVGDTAGRWVLGPRSAIRRGSLSSRVINSAPAL